VKKLWLGCLLLISLSLTACSNATMENYAKLKSGMSYAEVVAVIGKADSCSETLGIRSCIWGSEESNITANFVNDQVILLSNKAIK